MGRFRAMSAERAGAPLRPVRLPGPALGPLELRLAVLACGVCHSDVHLVDDDWGVSSFPLVPGHEIVGEILELGEGVRGLERGMRVGVGWQRSACWSCESCLGGCPQRCPEQEATCLGHTGGFAEEIVSDARFTFPLPEALDTARSAPLLCAGATVWSPLQRFRAGRPRVGVVGVGGLGHLALRFSAAMGLHTSALTRTPARAADAGRFGADAVYALSETGAPDSRFDLLLITSFADPDFPGLLRSLRPGGQAVMLGGATGELRVPAQLLLDRNLGLHGSTIASPAELREMLDFAARCGIGAEVETMPLSAADAALARVRAGEARYRVVLLADRVR